MACSSKPPPSKQTPALLAHWPLLDYKVGTFPPDFQGSLICFKIISNERLLTGVHVQELGHKVELNMFGCNVKNNTQI